MMEKIAVLLAVYNGRNWVDEQIESILKQSDVSLDLYINVDLSTDNSFNYLVDKYSSLPNVYFLPYGERYGSAGRNFYHLLLNVPCENYSYISFSDQDDIWNVNKLATAVTTLENNDYKAYSSNVIAFDKNNAKTLVDKAQPQVKYDHFFEAAGPGCTYVFTADLATQFIEFLRDNSEAQKVELHDWLLYAYSRQNKHAWFIDPNPSMLYRQHESNQVGANNSFAAWKKRISLVKKKWYRNEVNKLMILLGNNDTKKIFNKMNNGYPGRLCLAFQVCKFRRRLRDKLTLMFLFIFNIV